jgi:hypothetical protein
MKIGEYEQMMSWLTRPKSPQIEPRENFKGGTDPKTGMGFQKGNTIGQGRAKDLIGKPSINVEGKNQYIPRTTKEIQAIIDANPDYITPKNFYQPTDIMKKKGMKKLLTQSDVKNPDVIFQKKGKDPADPEKQTARNTKRKESILRQEGRQYNVKAPKGYQVHHMLPLAGNVDINTGDLAVISKKMNVKMSKYDKQINRLTTEATLLDFSKKNSLDRLDDINEKLNNLLKTIKKDLPKKYKGLIGFNKLTPVFDEYGTVLDLTAEPVGVDYKKSIAGSKGVPTRDVKTSDIQKLVNNAPKFKSEFIPGMNKAADYVSSTIEDLMKLRLGSAALKSLPIAGAAYTVYDTGVGLKEGRSALELLARTFGLDPLYRKGIQYAALSDEAQEAQKNINYQKSLEASLQDPLDESLMGLAPRQENTEAQLTQLANEQRIIDERMKQADDIRAQEREGIMNLIKNKIMGTPIQTTNFLAAGGRVGFADGGDPKDPKMNRRTFMKLMGGIASIPFLGKFAKPVAKVVESAAPVIQENIAGAPAHFWNLVNKIKLLGDDVTRTGALAERQSVKKYKDFELVEDTATGQIDIQRMKALDDDSASYYGNPLVEETHMSYKPGKGQADEMTGPIPDEYEEGTAYLRTDREYAGEVVDEVSGVSDDIFQEAGVPVPEAIRKK